MKPQTRRAALGRAARACQSGISGGGERVNKRGWPYITQVIGARISVKRENQGRSRFEKSRQTCRMCLTVRARLQKSLRRLKFFTASCSKRFKPNSAKVACASANRRLETSNVSETFEVFCSRYSARRSCPSTSFASAAWWGCCWRVKMAFVKLCFRWLWQLSVVLGWGCVSVATLNVTLH